VRTDYDPFGQPTGKPGLATPTDYGFAGEPQDAATGLVQLRARWYSPVQGQFTSRDPGAAISRARNRSMATHTRITIQSIAPTRRGCIAVVPSLRSLALH